MSLTTIPEINISGNMQSHIKNDVMQRWNAKIHANEGGIDILDVIGDEKWGGVSAKSIKRQIEGRGDEDLVVNINSPGGDVFEGVAIYNMLRMHQGKVRVNVLGIAASAASIIAMAADELYVPETGFLMIHNAWTIALGNKNDLRQQADVLDQIDTALLAAYRARTGMSDADLSQMMDGETFISGEEAVEMNFADALLEDGEISERRSERTAKLNARRLNEIALRAYAPDMTRSERKETMNTVKPSAGEATKHEAGGGKQNAALMDAIASLRQAV